MADIYPGDGESSNGNGISREHIKAAIAKAVELRALHAALMQGNSPGRLRFPSPSPVSRHSPHLSAQDYPVFTPTYDDEPLPGYQQILMENRNYSESWGEHILDGNGGNINETISSDYRTPNVSSRKGFPPELMSFDGHICPAEDQISVTGSCPNNINVLRASPGPDHSKSRRNSLEETKSVSSCNKCMPAVLSSESDGVTKNGRKSNIVVPLTDSHSSLHPQPRKNGLGLSWLFPNLKKKNKNKNEASQTAEASQVMFRDLGMVSIQTLKRELFEANEGRDAALSEVEEMKSSLGELNQKLEYLETYCEELKRALKQAVQVKFSQTNLPKPKQGKSIDGTAEDVMPVSEEVMAEGFLQVVSEARLSVKQFCKTLLGQIQENDHSLVDNLNSLLQPYKLSLNSKYSKAVLYHLEAIMNRSLYQDFENCIFQKNGTPKLLDPLKDCQARFQSFVALRNLSWNEVLRKGTKYYSEEFSKFCDQKMSGIIAALGWTRPWPEQLLEAFFVAAKCLWLLHLLAFSFDQPLAILRVGENMAFEANYMEDIFGERQRSQGTGRVKIMVTPGFYVLDRVLKCKVICRYKSVA